MSLVTEMAAKVSFDTVRKVALELPGVEEGMTYGTPAFKLNGNLMACRAINKSAEPNSLAVRIDMEQRDALIAEAPDTYYTTGHYVNYPVVLVRLSRVNTAVLRDLLRASWRFVSAEKSKRQKK
jgi:hypothetical protein